LGLKTNHLATLLGRQLGTLEAIFCCLTGWPAWANIRLLGDRLLGTIYWILQT
jgi:hypothetical protein